MKKTIIKNGTDCYLINKMDPGEHNFSFSVAGNSSSVIVQNLTGFTDIKIDFELAGSGSSVIFIGFLAGNGKDKISLETYQHHLAGGSSSRVIVRSVLYGESSVSYRGIIRVEKDSPGTDAFQQNNNLILSDMASAYSMPVLEILSGDLKCFHSASTSCIRPEELWYLQNRGIDRGLAEGMIAAGFLTDILSKIPKPEKVAKIIQEIPSLLGIYDEKSRNYESV